MSLKIDDYSSSIEAISALANQNNSAADPALDASAIAADGDSYIASDFDADKPMYCDTYNDILKDFAAARAASMNASESSASDSSTSENAGNASSTDSTEAASAPSGGSGGSESKDSTKTKIVMINSVTYLETTTVHNGVEKVTRTVLEDKQPNSQKNNPKLDSVSQGAAALSAM